MLERVAMHQTRLRTPGVGLDARGVVLGARGLVLFPSLDRLVAFLALYSGSRSLEDVVDSLVLEEVRSPLGSREVILTLKAQGSARMDRVAEVARLAGGFTFTGTARHFVQYRDAAAPFGYDVTEIEATDLPLSLHHQGFRQAYAIERRLDLRALLLALAPRPDPTSGAEPGPRWVVAEAGLGPALLGYLVRSRVEARVAVAEWPPRSRLEAEPVVRYLFRVEELPPRMRPLLGGTPGLSLFVPAGPGAAVEIGFRHPLELRAFPVFKSSGLVLFRGRDDPLEVEPLPALGDVRALARVTLGRAAERTRAAEGEVPRIDVPLRLVPTAAPFRRVVGARVLPEELPLLRRLAYALPVAALRTTRIAVTREGAYLLHPEGLEASAVGELFCRAHERVLVAAGCDVVPAVSGEVLHASFDAPPDQVIFLRRDGSAIGVSEDAFVPLERAVLDGVRWAPLPAQELEEALEAPLCEVVLSPLGLRPLADVAPAPLPPDAPREDEA